MRIFITDLSTISVSTDNVKLGPLFLAFSVPSIITCPKNAPCYAGCYANSLEHMRPTLKRALMDNLHALLNEPEEVEKKLVGVIKLMGRPKFRWNVDGDVEVDVTRPMLYIDMMVRIAKKCPKVSFTVYSKSSLWKGVKRPKNLHLLGSKWGCWSPDIGDDIPMTNILKKGDSREGKRICPNQLNKSITCSNCPLCSGGLKAGETVYFDAHGRNKNKV
jgi:hypothetical protein